MSKQMMLVQFSDNWADEIDIDGFVIVQEKKWIEYQTYMKSRKTSFTIGLGSNEDNEYQTGKQLLQSIKAKKITENEFKIIKKLLGTEYGSTAFWDALEYLQEDEQITT